MLQNGALVAGALEGSGPEDSLARADALKMPDGHRAQLADMILVDQFRYRTVRWGPGRHRALKFVLDVYAAAGWGPAAAQ